jgi:FkbM family methyltransferase
MQTDFVELCRKLVAPPITVIDVGADGGVDELSRLATLCHVHAFEPRKDSFEALRADSGQAKRYASIEFHNVGLAATAGTHRLYVTHVPQASSLRRPNRDIARRYQRNSIFEVVGETDIECTTLDDFAAANAIGHVDYLKVDTQGTELDILLGGRGLLKRTSIISTEVEFVELYEGQKLFDDVVRELSPFGFRFIDFKDGDRSGPAPGKRIWADALFARDVRGLDRAAGLRCAAVMLDMGYAGEAVWMLADLGVDGDEITRLRDAAARPASHAPSGARAVIRRLQDYNHARRDAGKLSISGYRAKELLRKLSLGLLD